MKRLPAIPVYLILATGSAMFFNLIFTVNMVYQVTVVGLSPLQLVLVGTTLEAAAFLFEVPTGVVADVVSRRLSIVIGYVLMGLGFILEGMVPTFGAVLANQLFFGIGYTFTSGATQAWIADEVGEERAGQAFLRGKQSELVGVLAGILVALALGNLRINIPIVVGGALLALLGLFLALFMPENGFSPTPREDRSSWQHLLHTFSAGLGLVRRSPGLVRWIAIGLFFGLYSEGFDRLWTAHLLENFALPGAVSVVTFFAALRFAATALTLLASEGVRRAADPDRAGTAVPLLALNSAAIVAGLLIFALARSLPLAAAAYLVISIARTLIEPYYTAALNRRLEPGVRATVLSMSSQMDALGQIGGGPVVGIIAQALSIRAGLATSALLLTPVLALLRRARPGEAAAAVPQAAEAE